MGLNKGFIPVLEYLWEKREMGMLDECRLEFPDPDGQPIRKLWVDKVKLNVWRRVIKPGMLPYVKIFKCEEFPLDPKKDYCNVVVTVKVRRND